MPQQQPFTSMEEEENIIFTDNSILVLKLIWIKYFSFSIVFEHYSHSTVVLNCLLLQKTQTVITGSLFKWCITKVLTFTNLLHNLENYPTFYFQKQLMLIGPEMLLTKTASLEREEHWPVYGILGIQRHSAVF